jgi:hypothetical protein
VAASAFAGGSWVMFWLRSVRLIAVVLAFVCCAATASVVSDSRMGSPAAAHCDGDECPESGPDGAPCETGCVCCPGPVPVSLPHETGVGFGALPVCHHPALPLDELQPDDLVQSIFNPPRRLTPA